MKKYSLLIISATLISSPFALAAPASNEESITSMIIGKVLTSIDYSKTTFNLSLFEGSFSSDEKNKSTFEINKLDSNLKLKFKDNVVISTNDIIKNLPQIPQTQQWTPSITLNFKDYLMKTNITTANSTGSKNESIINLQINFKKSGTNSAESNDALKIQVGNDLNKNLIHMNLTALNVNIGTSTKTPEMSINGFCKIDKISNNARQPVEVCAFSGKINPSTGIYNIKVKFSDKNDQQQNQLK